MPDLQGQDSATLTQNVSYAIMALNAGALFGYLGFGPLAERFGRRPVFGLMCLGSLILLPITYFVPHSYAEVLLLLPVLGFFSNGIFSGFPIYLPELYPTRLRATGVAVVSNITDRSTGQPCAPASVKVALGHTDAVVVGLATDNLSTYRVAVRPTLDLSDPVVWARRNLPALFAGDIQSTFDTLPSLLPFIRSGKLRAIAVGTAQRIAALPDVPTVQEMGYKDFETSQWYGIHVPAGTPPDIVRHLQEESYKALRSSAVTERFATDNAVGGGGPASEYAAYIAREQAIWKNIVERASIKPD